jgi:hypothetical protein
VRGYVVWSSRSAGIRRLLVAGLAIIGASGFLGKDNSANASLPNGRAWEMVSPLSKNGGNISGIEGDEVNSRTGVHSPTGDNGGGVVEASPEGNRITYVSQASFASGQGAPVGSQYVSSHNAEGWLTQNISTSTNDQVYVLGGAGTPYDAFSSDLVYGLELNGIGGFQVEHPVETPPLPNSGGPTGYQDYYLNEIHYPGELSSRALLSDEPSQPPAKFELEFLGATPDLGHIVLASGAKLATEAVEAEYTGGGHGNNLYEWEKANGQFQPVNVLPSGAPEPTQGLVLGGSGGATDHAISTDGSRVVWTSSTGLYVREGLGTNPRTVQADASQGGPESGGGRFLTASGSSGVGSKIFFADNNRLTSDSTATSGGFGDLYEFEPENGPLGRLTDLTVGRGAEGSAEVQGVLGAGDDGSYLYFVANGVLAAGASQGNCSTSTPLEGATCNLYLWHEGEPVKFIATLANGDESASGASALGVAFDWESRLGLRTTRVSTDGTHLLFMSERSLTGYDNTVNTGTSCGRGGNGEPMPAQCEEVFLFDATQPASPANPACVSCNPNGDRPTGPSSIPGGTEFHNNRALYESRLMSEGGERVFFDSAAGLVPQDINGEEDVYEYEGGHVYLLSSGTSSEGASFVDANTNGNDVFFITGAQLVSADTDRLVDLYDARAPHAPGEQVDFPVPPPVVPCEGDGCRAAAPAEPTYTFPSSASFAGPGNVVPVISKPAVKNKAKKAKPKPKKHRRGASKAERVRARRASSPEARANKSRRALGK